LEKKIETKLTQFPCPVCGQYFTPYLSRKDGKAMCECSKDGLFETSIGVSKNFRKFCSKIARKPNRSPIYYTSFEYKIKRILENLGLIEGLDFWHNVRVKFNNKSYTWLDFYIPRKDIIVRASPSVWHKMWSRGTADDRIKLFLESKGLNVIDITEKNYKESFELLDILIKKN